MTRNNDKQLSIPEFYRKKNIFITGGSGFIGKVLVEKILRSCPDVGNIYLLMREKKGKSPEERIKAITDLPLFKIVKKEHPENLKKIKIINGDVTKLGLGIKPDDKKTLMEECNIVFHGAASVRFDDPLTDAIIMNTRGTRETVNFALRMPKLEVFVHISTTYCNTDRPVIDEQLYPAHADWEKTIEVAENVDKHTLDALTPKYISPLPNTYTFTKSLAEHVVSDLCRGKVPSLIIRPSIVISSIEEPFPGWVDNFNGPVGLFVASGKGIVRTVYADSDIHSDYVPVDIIAKGVITATWKEATLNRNSKETTFYNFGKNDRYPITMGEIIEMGKTICAEVPLDGVVWYPKISATKCYYYYFIKMLFYQLIPAIFLDTLLRILGKKPLLVKIQRKVYIANMALSYFTLNKWKFLNEKAYSLKSDLLPCDLDTFGYEEDVDPLEYFKAATLGGREYILNEGADLTEAKKASYKMWILAQIFNVFWYSVLAWILFAKIDIISVISGILQKFYDYLFDV